MTLHRVPQRATEVHRVPVSPALTDLRDVPSIAELRHDALNGPLRDADRGGDIARARRPVLGDADEDVGMVREEGPSGAARLKTDTYLYSCG